MARSRGPQGPRSVVAADTFDPLPPGFRPPPGLAPPSSSSTPCLPTSACSTRRSPREAEPPRTESATAA
eukprot:14347517-Heterocapsa_arctica.AAC.1